MPIVSLPGVSITSCDVFATFGERGRDVTGFIVFEIFDALFCTDFVVVTRFRTQVFVSKDFSIGDAGVHGAELFTQLPATIKPLTIGLGVLLNKLLFRDSAPYAEGGQEQQWTDSVHMYLSLIGIVRIVG